MSHQQESFLPFSSRQSLSCYLSHVARGSTPKPRGSNSCPSWVVLSGMAAMLGLNARANLPLQPHFRLLITPASIPVFFQLYRAAIVTLGRCGPMAWSQSSLRRCNPGELPPSCGLKSLRSPRLKAWPQLFNIFMKPVKGYRYVKWPRQKLATQLLLYKTALNGPVPCVPSPSSGLWGWGHPIYFFSLIFPEHPEFWTPLQIPLWAPPLGCTRLQDW